jgi:hypothetical protein
MGGGRGSGRTRRALSPPSSSYFFLAILPNACRVLFFSVAALRPQVHDFALLWLQPERLTSSSPAAATALSAYVVYPEGVPVVHALDHFCLPDRSHAEVRSLELQPVTKVSSPCV